MISDNQTCAEFESAIDWPHLALSVHSEEETNFDLPTEEEDVDKICAKKPKHVVLQYTTIDIETVPGSSTETIEAIEYQEKWEKDVEGWFKKSNYEPAGHKTLDSEPVFDCEQGIERLQRERYQQRNSWEMRRDIEKCHKCTNVWLPKLPECLQSMLAVPETQRYDSWRNPDVLPLLQMQQDSRIARLGPLSWRTAEARLERPRRDECLLRDAAWVSLSRSAQTFRQSKVLAVA
ncbi:hypothetical protein LZL87_013738 [Fusarium oxysporum]|nr:hypothetical protein LZL87_013738 [Fusarium oxysporum]